MDFPLVNAALASVADAGCNVAEPSDISGLKAAVHEPSLKYRAFDNLDALPDRRLSNVANHTKDNVANNASEPPVFHKDAMEGLSGVPNKQTFSAATFDSKSSPDVSVHYETKQRNDVKQRLLRDVFAFLDSKPVDTKPSSNLRDLFR
jgi:hypothetical protein